MYAIRSYYGTLPRQRRDASGNLRTGTLEPRVTWTLASRLDAALEPGPALLDFRRQHQARGRLAPFLFLDRHIVLAITGPIQQLLGLDQMQRNLRQ